ncbi:hypothetical protein FXO37_15657 [Capsicum annuum]|nr:hypothetical protein FXO37_15657 [Capsicum annuum]
MEFKFVACTSTVQEAVWLKRLFEHLNITKNSKGPIILYCDSQASIAYAKDPKYQSKDKHIDIMYNFVDRTHSYFNLSVKLQVQVCLRIVNFWAPSDYPSLGDRLTYQGPMAGKAVKSVAKAVGGYQYPWQKNWQNARMRFQREFGVTGSLEIENLWGSVLSIELVSARKLFLLDKIGHMIQRGRKCERGRKGTSVTEYLLRNGQRQLNCCKKCLKCWLILGREGEKGK